MPEISRAVHGVGWIEFLRNNQLAQNYHNRLVSKHGKGKALSILAHKLGRAVYFMLKRKESFNMNTFFKPE
jgi:hypothetical protein